MNKEIRHLLLRSFAILPIAFGSSLCLAGEPEVIDRAIYLMTVNQYSSGFSEGSAKFDDLILIQIVPGKSATKKGSEIPFFRGGIKAGAVKLEKKVAIHCDSQAWGGKISSGSKMEKGAFAIASDSKEIKGHSANDRALSKTEENGLLDLVIKEFKKKSFSVKKKSISLDSNKVIFDNAHPEVAIWVGSMTVKNPKEILRLFLIADLKNGSFVPLISNFHATKDLEDSKDDDTETYADHFPMTGGNFDKIVTEIRGYESTSFKIYVKTPTGWKLESESGESGC